MKFFRLESLFRGDSCRDKISLGCNFFPVASHKITLFPQPMVAIHGTVSRFHSVSRAIVSRGTGYIYKKAKPVSRPKIRTVSRGTIDNSGVAWLLFHVARVEGGGFLFYGQPKSQDNRGESKDKQGGESSFSINRFMYIKSARPGSGELSYISIVGL